MTKKSDEENDFIRNGIALFQRDDNIAAIDLFDKAISINKNSSISWLYKALCLTKLKRYTESIESFDEVLRIDSRNIDAYYNKGVVLELLKNFDHALECYDKSLEIDPIYGNALTNKSRVLGNMGRYEESIEWSDKALTINPNNYLAYNNKAVSLELLGRHDEAIKNYDIALKINPKCVLALRNKGIILEGMGRFEEARRYFNMVEEAGGEEADNSYKIELRVRLDKSKKDSKRISDSKQESPPSDLELSTDERSQYVPTLKDLPASEDRLGRKTLAQVVANTIERVRTENIKINLRGPFLVNVHGPWGSGKTTLSNFICDELKNKSPPWIIVKFNAWEYQRLNNPPWWLVLDAIFREGCKNIKLDKRIKLKFWEYSWRFWTWNSNLSWGIALFAVFIAITVFFFSQMPSSQEDQTSAAYSNLFDLMKNVGVLIGLGGSLISGIALIRNSLIPGSVKSAREIIERASDPTKKFNSHFNKLIDKIKSPILVFIDDLDRCKDSYVVEFLEGIHTIFKGANVYYIITADQRWIYRSYESIYQTFVNLDEESGRPLGYLFTDKIFQLLVPLPKLGRLDQEDYFDYILLNKSPDKTSEPVDNKLNKMKNPNEIINLVNKGTSGARENKKLREMTVLKLDEKEMQEKTKHFLQPFVSYLEPNPRSMIRYVNIFNVVRAVNILSATRIDNEKLALWLIVAMRWPVLARHLQTNPEDIQYIGSSKDINKTYIRPEIRHLFKNPDVEEIINKNHLKISIDKDTIRNIILWSL